MKRPRLVLGRGGTRGAQIWGGATLLLGAATVLGAQRWSEQLARGRPSARVPVAVLTVLGLRQAAQGTVVTLAPDGDVVAIATAIDLLHGTSMVAAAMAMPRFRRPALLAAALAAVSAAAGGTVLGSGRTGLPR